MTDVEIRVDTLRGADAPERIRGTITRRLDSGAATIDGDDGESYVRRPTGAVERVEEWSTLAGSLDFHEVVAFDSELEVLGGATADV